MLVILIWSGTVRMYIEGPHFVELMIKMFSYCVIFVGIIFVLGGVGGWIEQSGWVWLGRCHRSTILSTYMGMMSTHTIQVM